MPGEGSYFKVSNDKANVIFYIYQSDTENTYNL